MRWFNPIHGPVRLLGISIALLLLTGCPYDAETGQSVSFQALQNGGLASYRATVYGNVLLFPKISTDLLKPNGIRPFLKIEYKIKRPFSMRRLSFGINGIRAYFPKAIRLAHYGQWVKEGDRWQLWIDLSRLVLHKRKLLRHVDWLQSRGGNLQIWVRGPEGLIEGGLVFADAALDKVAKDFGVPSVKITRIAPAGEKINSRSISFTFKASETASKFRCSFDGRTYRRCASPKTYRRLKLGPHVFRVQARGKNKSWGPVTTYRFFREQEKPGIELVRISPDKSPTRKRHIRIKFEAPRSRMSYWKKKTYWYWKRFCRSKSQNRTCRWAKGVLKRSKFWKLTRAYCRLDEGKFKRCKSPLRYRNLAEGPHTVEIKAADRRFESASYSWVIDRTAPKITWDKTPPAENSLSKVEFQFSSNESVEFFCSLNKEKYERCKSPYVIEGIEEGSHRLSVRARDLAGNRSNRLDFSWTKNSDIPVVEIVGTNPQNSPTATTSMELSFTASQPVTFFCFLDGLPPSETELQPYECTSPIGYENLEDGAHSISVIGRNAAGQWSEAATYGWVIDTLEPNLNLVMESPLSTPTNQDFATFSFQTSEASNFSCVLDDEDPFICNSPLRLSQLSEGAHTVSVTATDSAGNQSSQSFSWSTDYTAPELILQNVFPAEALTLSRSLVVDFSVDDPQAAVTCELNGGGALPCMSPYLINDLADGDHQLVITATDTAGNQADRIYSWSVYSPAEVAIDSIFPSETPTHMDSLLVGFSSATSNEFYCSLDGATPTSCESPIQYSNLSDGAHQFEVYAIDRAGVAGPPVSYSWMVDTGPLVAFDVSVSNITETSALVTWKTNLPASSQVAYGLGTFLNLNSPLSSQGVTNHSVLLTGLESFALYSFQVISVDGQGREVRSVVSTFRTLR